MSGLHEMSGSCHCGNITYTFVAPLPQDELSVRTCDCSFCTMHGACYTSHPQGSLKVRVADRSLVSSYRFGSKAADVFLCSRCGVYPFILSAIDGRLHAVINANSINGLQIDRAQMPPALHLQEQTREERIGRWKRAWIPRVEISYQVNAALL